jgi:hypothetical protein
MSEHTPGPWNVASYADESNCLNVIAGEEKHVDGRTQAHWIAELDTNSDDDFDVVEANARLIAAAPDLLAACNGVAHWLPQFLSNHGKDTDVGMKLGGAVEDYRRNVLDILRAMAEDCRIAIIKATGESP